jgi:tyrosyl-tRNA synthetase
MILQAFDFLFLSRRTNCALQLGGNDQWSNMLAGIDLIHKKDGKEVFALTLPLLLNADGTKMGKTEKGAIWLNGQLTTPLEFFQFWRNLPDTEVIKCFRLLTFLSLEEIDNLPFSSVLEINQAKKMLAFEITKLVHGEETAQTTLKTAEALFESLDSSVIDVNEVNEGVQLLDLLVKFAFSKSRTDARNTINGRGVTINGQLVTDPLMVITKLQCGSEFTLKKGKKHFGRFSIKETND